MNNSQLSKIIMNFDYSQSLLYNNFYYPLPEYLYQSYCLTNYVQLQQIQQICMPFYNYVMEKQSFIYDNNNTNQHQLEEQQKHNELRISSNIQNQQKQLKKLQYLGRNDFSNMFKSFLFLIFKCEKTKNHIKQLITKLNLDINLNIFINKLKRKFPQSKTYVGPKQIRNFVSKNNDNDQSTDQQIYLLFKILLRDFLQKQYKLYIIKKYKGKNQTKKDIFKKCRLLYDQIFIHRK